MNVNFLGDLHCKRVTSFKKNVIQIGDLCLEDYSKFSSKDGNRFFIDGNHDHFPSLNPDAKKPYSIKEGLVYIPRGFFSGEVLFMGGANSVDFNNRFLREMDYLLYDIEVEADDSIHEAFGQLKANSYVRGGIRWEDKVDPVLVDFYSKCKDKIEWFKEEEITEDQLNRVLNTNRVVDVVVAHDCPYFLMKEIVYRVHDHFASCNRHLETIFNNFKPKLWIFGHHHQSLDIKMKGCRFICLAIDENRLIDVPLEDNFFDIKY